MKRFWLRLAKFAAALAFLLNIVAGAQAAETLRYLFLIDHSPEMATRQISTVQTIHDVIRGGFENQIQPGERFALWFYGSRLQTNAPFTWQPGREAIFARQAAGLFTGRIFSRLRPREQTLADAASLIAASPKLTIFIVTDGSQPLSGTPFDDAINTQLDARRMLFMTADKPFIITIVAKKGALVDAAIYTDVRAPFRIPEIDRHNELIDQALAAVRNASSTPPQKPANSGDLDKALTAVRAAPTTPPQTAAATQEQARAALRDALSAKPTDNTNAPIPVTALQFAPALKDPPKEETKPIEQPRPIEQPKPVEQKAEPRVVPPPVVSPETLKPDPKPIESPAPQPATTKPIEIAAAPVEKAPEPKPILREEPKPAAPEPKPVVQEQPKPPVHEEPKPIARPDPKSIVQQSPPPETKPTPQPPKVVEQPKPATPPPVAQTSRSTSPPPPIQVAVVTPKQKGFPWPILIGGFAAIAVGGAFAVVRARRRAKSLGSLITQALPRNGPRPK